MGKNMKEVFRNRVGRIIIERDMVQVLDEISWKKLQEAVRGLPFPPPYVLKDVCEEKQEYHKFEDDVYYWGDWSDEALLNGNFFAIEWIKVRPRYKQKQGRLVNDKIIDERGKFKEILEKCNIPFNEEDNMFIIYGYQRRQILESPQ